MDYNLHLMSINENSSTKSLGKLTFLNDSEQVKISQVFHCEGLLLCILKDDNSKVVVWNPYLGQRRWIKIRFESRDKYKYAIGYDNKKNKSSHSHKILRFRNSCNYYTRYEIYDLDSDSWAILINITPKWRIGSYNHGVSLKENTYWLAREGKAFNHIIYFDFTSERFGPLIHLPFHVSRTQTISCVREEKLAFLGFQFRKIEIWITTKIEAEKISWSKFLTIDTEIDDPISYWSFFIHKEKKVVIGFDEDDQLNHHNTLNIIGEGGYFAPLDLGVRADKTCNFPHVWSYVPSLVQIKQPKQLRKASQIC